MHFNVSSADRSEWRAEALRDIKEGDVLEFFYPSTEWDMAQPFECSCGAKVSRMSRMRSRPCFVHGG